MLLSFLSSIRFLLLLLALLCLVSIIGIIIPQGGDPGRYLSHYGAFFAAVVTACGWDRVFSSPWFIIPLGLLCLNLVACIGVRCRSWWTLFPSVSRSSLTVTGSLMLHAGILFLVASGIMQYYFGATQTVVLAEKTRQPVLPFSFQVTLRDFAITHDGKGRIADYQSVLELHDLKGNSLVRGTTRVNDPFTYRTCHFYQTMFGRLPDVIRQATCMVIDPSGDTLHNGPVPFNKPVRLAARDMVLLCDRFQGDFVRKLATGGQVSSRPHRHRNPAFRITLRQNGAPVFSGWVFRDRPADSGACKGYTIRVLSYEPAYYSGIQIQKKAGTPLVWSGFALVSIGLVLVFLLRPRERS
ncbi:MAG: cytochrome c biogenesis protein ResB [Chitinispirillaceae bacterium]|nr:cytochrome c biogenesis protein ResB [Chitinispirillaceae bacterium]